MVVVGVAETGRLSYRLVMAAVDDDTVSVLLALAAAAARSYSTSDVASAPVAAPSSYS